MILNPDRYSTGAPTFRNGVVVHDSEGGEGTMSWGQTASAQLVQFLSYKGDRPSPTRPGFYYGSGYQAVAREDGTFVEVADDTVGPYHAGGGINPNMWSICMPGKASQTREQWLNDVSREYVRAVARYIVDRWNHDGRIWPLTFRSGAQLRLDRANERGHPSGYTSHAQVTVSKLTSTDHGDPGVSFPWDVLAADIAEYSGANAPKPTPPTLTDGGRIVDVFTNSEVFFGSPPNVYKGVIMPNGKPRHMFEPEWIARGRPAGRPLSNAELAALFADGAYVDV